MGSIVDRMMGDEPYTLNGYRTLETINTAGQDE
jgi:hypothetical protein